MSENIYKSSIREIPKSAEHTSLQYKGTFLALLLFVVSLPFNAIEWKILPFGRMEIKITMITFALLFLSWLLFNINFPRKRCFKEIVFYLIVILYASSQFLSITNSIYPSESFKQGIIVLSLLIMMVVVSETVLNKRVMEYVFYFMGVLSLFIGNISLISFFALNDGSGSSRLGQAKDITLGIIDLGGDSFYFGDILLYSIGAVSYVVIRLSEHKYMKLLVFPLLLGWYSAIILTFSKGLIIAVFCFIFCVIIFLKGKRRLMILTMVLFIATIDLAPQFYKTFVQWQILMKEPVQTDITAQSKPLSKVNQEIETDIVAQSKPLAETPAYKKAGSNVDVMINRLQLHSILGMNSVAMRVKAIIISVQNTMPNFWFGRGAGTSQKILPGMADIYDEKADAQTRTLMTNYYVYGKGANRGLIDSHILFVTEFFNVGFFGLVSLTAIIFFVIIEQLKLIMSNRDKNNKIMVLLFANLIAMLAYRMTGSLIVIPFLWFMLGLSFGLCRLYWNVASNTG